ncbi:ANTAR domain-containing protein [Aquihabitans sp. McL0605]|uniref:ANTAR domain-containing protein n=1 Tax=Aquihabitans sp. McL0605 TaxID=3415671 RepID=UPI003CE9EBC4
MSDFDPPTEPLAVPRDPASAPLDFGQVARTLMEPKDVAGVLQRIAVVARAVLTGSDHCGVTVAQRGKMWTAGASDDLPARLDALQHEVGEGPSVEAIRVHDVCDAPDLATDGRWPAFAERAVAETPVRSVLSYRLYLDDRTLGALTAYADRPHAFDAATHEVGSLLAAQAAIALASAEDVHHLRIALQSRDLISTAKGILMAREGMSETEAFDVLRRASRRSNISLRELAERVVSGAASAAELNGQPHDGKPTETR